MAPFKRSPGLGQEQCRILLAFGIENGMTAHECLKHTGLSETDLENIGFEPSAEQELEMVKNLCEALNDSPEYLGYLIGQRCKLHNLGLIGQAMLSSQNLKEAFDVALRYFQKAYHFIQCDSITLSPHIYLNLHCSNQLPDDLNQFLVARDLGLCVSITKDITPNHSIAIEQIGMFFRDPKLIESVAELQPKHITQYDRGVFVAVNEKSALLPMPQYSPQTSKLLEDLCYTQLVHPAVTKAGALENLRFEISQLLEDHRYALSREEASSKLCISSRTLSRYLKQDDTTWRDLVAQCRIDRAKELLSFPNLTIEEIAESVGFGSSSAFSLAFKRATGLTASEYRKRTEQHPMQEHAETGI